MLLQAKEKVDSPSVGGDETLVLYLRVGSRFQVAGFRSRVAGCRLGIPGVGATRVNRNSIG